jgi:hypothetical protein
LYCWGRILYPRARRRRLLIPTNAA